MKKAFTLAEVLITLGIIGIVAAMTLPVLTGKYQKKLTAVKLKQVYNTFSQALVKSQYDNGHPNYWETPSRSEGPSSSYEDSLEYFNTYWKPYLKVIRECKTMLECGYSQSSFSYITHENEFRYYGQYSNVPGFVLSDGTYFYIRPWGFNNIRLQLLVVDINGSKKPNAIGRDVFQFQIPLYSEKVFIQGYGDGENCTRANLSGVESSRGCSSKIIKDGWEIKDDYPW